MPMDFGFTSYNKPQWEVYLENIREDIIKETGLSREKLKQILEVLYVNRIIN